jgi:hypothetical protein
MLNIIVDGEKVGGFNIRAGNFISLGSCLYADVRLDWAAETSLTIHCGNANGRFVVVHDEEGMTHKGGHRFPDDGWRIFVGMGEPMTIRGHEIVFTSDIDELAQRLETCNMQA